MEEEFSTQSPEETIRRGKEFGRQLRAGDVVALQGELGAGKTHFVKGVASAMGIDSSEVHSPTYTLIHEYQSEIPLYHFDCYRMKSAEEAFEIGAEEYFYGRGVSIIEWPEKIEMLIPSEAIWVTIIASDKTTRKFVINKKRA